VSRHFRLRAIFSTWTLLRCMGSCGHVILELVLDLEIKCCLRCNRTRFSSVIVLLIYWKLITWYDLDLDLDRYVVVHTHLKPFSTPPGFLSHNLHFRLWFITSAGANLEMIFTSANLDCISAWLTSCTDLLVSSLTTSTSSCESSLPATGTCYF